MDYKILYLPILWTAKFLFWFVFADLAFLLFFISSQIWQDNAGDSNTSYIVYVYGLLMTVFIVSLCIRRKIWRYISATAVILLFLWAVRQPELVSYFGFFNLDF